MRYSFLAIPALALLLGCAGDPQTRAQSALAVACGGIGTMNSELSPLVANRSLSDSQVKVIVGIRDATAPYCSPDSKADPASVVTFVESALARLRDIKEKF